MFNKLNEKVFGQLERAEAHCDAPCGVYDPSSARVPAEAVLSLTKKILDLKTPEGGDAQAERQCRQQRNSDNRLFQVGFPFCVEWGLRFRQSFHFGFAG